MARKQTLKVYRTPIGFHDAYVAAPSQKAALTAWGSDANLFARGIAEQVDDPELTAEPLAKPGVVIRRSRGTTAEQIAALPPDTPRPPHTPRPKARRTAETPPAPPPPPPKPRPSRNDLDAAEQALADAQADHRKALDEITRRERDLAKERSRLERDGARTRDDLDARVDAARDAYEAAMRGWRG